MKALKFFARADGLALLALVLIAVPIKYGLGHAQLVRVLGPLHRVLFISLIISSAWAAKQGQIRPGTAALFVLAALLPFGAFYAEHKLKPHTSSPQAS